LLLMNAVMADLGAPSKNTHSNSSSMANGSCNYLMLGPRSEVGGVRRGMRGARFSGSIAARFSTTLPVLKDRLSALINSPIGAALGLVLSALFVLTAGAAMPDFV
jgi:hypothetical protein